MSARRRLAFALALALALPFAARAAVAAGGAEATPWRALGSDDVEAVLVPGEAVPAVATLRYDFHHRAGYAGLERELAVDWPENFELVLELDGHVAGNDLEVKFVDDSGDNVWWYRRTRTTLEGPTTIRIRRRQVEFAWGPAKDHALTRTARLQLIVNAVEGGAGTLTVGRVRLLPRAPVPAEFPEPLASVDGGPSLYLAGSPDPGATCRGRPCTIAIDALAPREFGGLTLAWARRPVRYTLESSDDQATWRPLGTIAGRRPRARPAVAAGVRGTLHPHPRAGG